MVRRLLPFLAAVGTAAVTYAALRDTWMRAPEVAPYVGTSAETIRLLILVLTPISPTAWLVVGLLYLGIRTNRDVIPGY